MGKTKWQVREALGLTRLPDDELMRLLDEAGEEETVAGGVPVNGDGYAPHSIRDALVRRSVGEALAAVRAETGSSLRGAGNASGLSHTRIQQIEASINVEVATVVRVAAALGYGVRIVLEPKPDGAGGARTVTADLTDLA